MGMTKRHPLMVANHKMNLHHLEVIQYLQKLTYRLQPEDTERVEVVIAPAFTNLRTAGLLIETDRLPFGLGAQHVHWSEKGAFTGEVSPLMLARLHTQYVIIGHSERRQHFGETDELVNRRIKAVLSQAQHPFDKRISEDGELPTLQPILCVGETWEQREQGETDQVVSEMLYRGLAKLDTEQLHTVVVAYEPVWAIGTGRSAQPEQAAEVMIRIRKVLAELGSDETAEHTRLLYGGSVNPGNIKDFMVKEAIDGALVGGASLDPDKFAAVIRYWV